jgi:DNA-binding transcriptional LysR family regulator
VHWEHLFFQPLALSVPPTHRLAGRRRVSLADVSEEDFVMLHPSWALRTLTDELCASAGFTPRVAFECDELSVARGFVNAGLGVAVIPAAEPGRRTRTSRAEPLIRLSDPEARREVGLAWSLGRRRLLSAELFRQYVIDDGLRWLGTR